MSTFWVIFNLVFWLVVGASIGHIVAAVFLMKAPPFGLPWGRPKSPPMARLAVAQSLAHADLRRISRARLKDKPVDEDAMLTFEDGWVVVDSDEDADW